MLHAVHGIDVKVIHSSMGRLIVIGSGSGIFLPKGSCIFLPRCMNSYTLVAV